MSPGRVQHYSPTRQQLIKAATLPPERGGVGSATIQALRSVGGAIGVALLGTLANSGYRDGLDLPPLPAAARDQITGSVTAGVKIAQAMGRPDLLATVRSAFVQAMDTTLWVCGGIAVLSAILAALFLRARR